MLTIGEFSRLARVSARMLRHYDAIGLLSPSRVGDNGYRYYDQRQLADIALIEKLKGFGFPLAQIGDLMKLGPGELAKRVHARRIAAYGEINALRARVRRMEEDIARMEGIEMYDGCYDVIIMNTPPQRVLSLRKTINVGEIHGLFEELLSDMQNKGLKKAGATQMLYHCQEFSYDSIDAEAQVVVEGEAKGVKEEPAKLCVSTMHKGPYENIKYAYEALSAYMAAHPEYTVCGPAVERYIVDEHDAPSPEDYQTGVMFPVAKAD